MRKKSRAGFVEREVHRRGAHLVAADSGRIEFPSLGIAGGMDETFAGLVGQQQVLLPRKVARDQPIIPVRLAVDRIPGVFGAGVAESLGAVRCEALGELLNLRLADRRLAFGGVLRQERRDAELQHAGFADQADQVRGILQAAADVRPRFIARRDVGDVLFPGGILIFKLFQPRAVQLLGDLLGVRTGLVADVVVQLHDGLKLARVDIGFPQFFQAAAIIEVRLFAGGDGGVALILELRQLRGGGILRVVDGFVDGFEFRVGLMQGVHRNQQRFEARSAIGVLARQGGDLFRTLRGGQREQFADLAQFDVVGQQGIAGLEVLVAQGSRFLAGCRHADLEAVVLQRPPFQAR